MNLLREYIRNLLEKTQSQDVTYDRRGRPTPTSGTLAFMGEYKSLTKHNPIGYPGDRYWYMGEIDGKYCLVITNVKVDPFHGNAAYFSSIQTVPPDVCEGQGFASKIMKKITDLADKHQVALRLDAVPFGQESVAEEDLAGWYKRAGFTRSDPDYSESMVREPR